MFFKSHVYNKNKMIISKKARQLNKQRKLFSNCKIAELFWSQICQIFTRCSACFRNISSLGWPGCRSMLVVVQRPDLSIAAFKSVTSPPSCTEIPLCASTYLGRQKWNSQILLLWWVSFVKVRDIIKVNFGVVRNISRLQSKSMTSMIL